MRPDVIAWLDHASADAERRGRPELKPLLETLARSLDALRQADAEFQHPAMPAPDDDPAS
jgi:hypothetical protein